MTWISNESFKVEEWEPRHTRQRWEMMLQGRIVGPPQATDEHTVAELQGMGYVGIYEP